MTKLPPDFLRLKDGILETVDGTSVADYLNNRWPGKVGKPAQPVCVIDRNALVILLKAQAELEERKWREMATDERFALAA